jgi:hypothetical protein
MDNYEKRVEDQFHEFKIKFVKRNKVEATSCQTVLQYLLDQHKKGIIWTASWELGERMNSNGGYLSHRAPARASDLALHSDLVEHRKLGRFKIYRLRMENESKIMDFIKNGGAIGLYEERIKDQLPA